jgi:hypothetical protein
MMTANPTPWTTLVDVATLSSALSQGDTRLLDARATASAAPRVLDARFRWPIRSPARAIMPPGICRARCARTSTATWLT